MIFGQSRPGIAASSAGETKAVVRAKRLLAREPGSRTTDPGVTGNWQLRSLIDHAVWVPARASLGRDDTVSSRRPDHMRRFKPLQIIAIARWLSTSAFALKANEFIKQTIMNPAGA